MVESYEIGKWLTCQQQIAMNRCDFLTTIIINTMFCSLYRYKLHSVEEKELSSIIDYCRSNIIKYNNCNNPKEISTLVINEMEKIFKEDLNGTQKYEEKVG